MQFDPDNKVVQLCAKGIEAEVKQDNAEAKKLFMQAWNEASTDFEKFTAAHYVARHQPSIKEKLKWDETALSFASKINDKNIQTNYPSLYLNIAKCYEDLNDLTNAQKNYVLALSYTKALPDDGYGRMIKSGIQNGLKRVSK